MADEKNEYCLSQAAWDEFQRQEVFPSLDEFVGAMSMATRSIHLVPLSAVDMSGIDKDSLVIVVAAEQDLFGPLSQVHVNPDREDPPNKDESMYQVDDADDLTKDQSSPDSIHQEYRPQLNHPQGPGNSDVEPWERHHHPGDADDYKRNHLNRDYANSSDISSGDIAVLVPWEVLTSRNERVALTWTEITSGLNPAVKKNSADCQVRLKKADPKNRRWTFVVASGSENKYVVQVKAIPRKNATSLEKVDLRIGCTCDFWKWQGPDHWAKTDGYLDLKQRSDGSAPTVRDPQGKNRVCKHVYAASRYFLKYSLQSKTASQPGIEFELPSKTSLSIRRLASNLSKYT